MCDCNLSSLPSHYRDEWKLFASFCICNQALEERDSYPPCMGEVFRCLGKVSRAALCAIARHLRLRSDVFNQLLDDTSLPPNEASSSVLVASYSRASVQNGKVAVGGGKSGMIYEVEKGLLTLIASDCPGLQVCDPNGRWFVADGGSGLGIFYCSQAGLSAMPLLAFSLLLLIRQLLTKHQAP
ncbi:hypothetical protein AMTRI_Chr03g143470 [Amborella trichopoda]